MHQFQDFNIREVPFSQLDRSLTEREEAHDGLVVSVGLRPARRLTPSSHQLVPKSSVLYCWPSENRPAPRPHAR